MILFTGGFPYSGKSLLLDKLLENFNIDSEDGVQNALEVVRMCPKDLLPENHSTLPESEKSDWAISAWEMCIEETLEILEKYDNKTLIIFDTAAAKVKRMRTLFSKAKKMRHTVIYAFIHADLVERKERTKIDLEKFENYYRDSFKVTVPHLKMISDKFMLIKNPNDPEYIGLTKSAKNLSKLIEEIKTQCHG